MSTPMMQQYNKLKDKHPDTILLFRLGDFYEAFNDDAKDISKILNITLTGRGQNENRMPMAGIPHHALKRYLKKLVNSGRKVAIAEQMEEAGAGKLVERAIVKIVTAGTISEIDYLDESKNNYLAAVFNSPSKKDEEVYCIAYCDLTTGEFKTLQLSDRNALTNELYRLHPNEILIPARLEEFIRENFQKTSTQTPDEELWDLARSIETLTKHFKTKNMKGFGYSDNDNQLIPAGVILDYLLQTQKTDIQHINKLTQKNQTKVMNMDPATIINLELLYSRNPDTKDASLFGILNQCQTAMGQRKLRNWIINPLIDKELIENRLNAVSEIIKDPIKLDEVRDSLDNICDMERVISKIGTGSINARDFLFLANSLQKILKLNELTKDFKEDLIKLQSILDTDNLAKIQTTIELIEKAITEDPPNTITEGGMIKLGFNAELDEIKQIRSKGHDWLKELQMSEIKRTGITSLKVKFNNVFGYYIEVSKSYLDKVPDTYIRKQTLVNAERFITSELKEWEEKILNAEGKANELEYKIFSEIREKVAENIPLFQTIGEKVADIDVFSNFAHIARQNNYIKPEINEKGVLEIKNGRHPVVEKFISDSYISNDLVMSSSKGEKDNKEANGHQIMILTGPNMSGKSTYIRQNALIILMAQIGSFIPAEKANLPVIDRIFTRVGASDNLAAGESTFMVEMRETANILNNATDKSFIIFDEVGRGTSTYDGVAIAWSIVEYLHNQIGAKTLFATHYHELIDLGNKLNRVKNYNVDVIEEADEIKFTRKVVSGGTDQSYGVYVAQMAGVPMQIIGRSKEILMTLEQENMLDVKKIESELISKQMTKASTPTKNRNDKFKTTPKKNTKISKKQLELI